MHSYKYPLEDSQFLFENVLKVDELAEQYQQDELTAELQTTVLQEAAKICESVIAPLNRVGDTQGPELKDGVVSETPGFKDAFVQLAQNGWTSLISDPEYGGQGLPHVLGTAFNEILCTSNLSFSLLPLLTEGSTDAIHAHAEPYLKDKYLPKMLSGDWSGTMNLTEPDAGSDLAAIKTKAVPEGDHYRISGQKIYITWGEHSVTENIIHLVLARLPDAPPGVKGISLFLVPKFLVNEDGSLGERNDLKCVSIEHKLGIHASPTCVMSFGEAEGAIGYLVGAPNDGLGCMFTMMNNARQGVGIQGLGVSERAYQLARAYAKERLQGTKRDGSRFSIMHFADVRRLLMLMKAGTEAMRAFAYVAGLQHDIYRLTGDSADNARLELYTPIVKAWMTELSLELTSLGVQIHGGMGFVEETGAAQHYRDARILTIYEGTTAIQGNDLIGRKMLLNGGTVLAGLLAEIESDLQQVTAPSLDKARQAMQAALGRASTTAEWILEHAKDPHVANAIGSNMAMLLGYLCGGWMLLKSAQAAAEALEDPDANTDFCDAKIQTAGFYADHYLPRVSALADVVMVGSDHLMAMPEEMF